MMKNWIDGVDDMKEYWVNVYEEGQGGKFDRRLAAIKMSYLMLKHGATKTIYRIHVKMKPKSYQGAYHCLPEGFAVKPEWMPKYEFKNTEAGRKAWETP